MVGLDQYDPAWSKLKSSVGILAQVIREAPSKVAKILMGRGNQTHFKRAILFDLNESRISLCGFLPCDSERLLLPLFAVMVRTPLSWPEAS